MTTINELKKTIGYGARPNRYLIEISYEGLDNVKLNLLCKNVNVPSKTIQTQTITKHGRKYNVRGEIDYGQTVTCTFYEDDEYSVRRQFDAYLAVVDDSARFFQLGGHNYKGSSLTTKGGVFWHIQNAVDTYRDMFKSTKNIGQTLRESLSESLSGVSGASAPYQTEVNIWGLDNDGNKKYGIQLQNAFVSGLESSPYDDSVTDQIIETTVTFTYSEFVPLTGTGTKDLIQAITGFKR